MAGDTRRASAGGARGRAARAVRAGASSAATPMPTARFRSAPGRRSRSRSWSPRCSRRSGSTGARARGRHGLRLPGGAARGARRRSRLDRARSGARGRRRGGRSSAPDTDASTSGSATARSACPSVRRSTGSSSPPRRRPCRPALRPALARRPPRRCRSERGATSGSRSSSAARPGRSACGPCRAGSSRCSARQGSTTPAAGRASLVRGQTASTLLRVPVLTRGIRLGEVESVLLDAEEPRILGLEVHCGDGASRFLPFSTARRGRKGSRSTARSRCSTRASSSSTAPTAARSRSVPELADARIEPDGALLVPLSAQR